MPFVKKGEPGYVHRTHSRKRKEPPVPPPGAEAPQRAKSIRSRGQKIELITDIVLLGRDVAAHKWGRSKMTCDIDLKKAQSDIPLWEEVQKHIEDVANMKIEVTKKTVKKIGEKQAAALVKLEEIRNEQTITTAQLLLTSTKRMLEIVQDPATPPVVVLNTLKALTDRAAADEVTKTILGREEPAAVQVHEAQEEQRDPACIN